MDRWVEVRSLSVSGLSIRAMARKLRMSKKTIRKILRGEETPVKEIRRKDAFAHLVPHRDAIVAMLKARLIGTRIFHELRKLGYKGGRTVLYRYIGKLKSEEDLGQEKATVRFETAPGVQAQFDWSVYRVPPWRRPHPHRRPCPGYLSRFNNSFTESRSCSTILRAVPDA